MIRVKLGLESVDNLVQVAKVLRETTLKKRRTSTLSITRRASCPDGVIYRKQLPPLNPVSETRGRGRKAVNAAERKRSGFTLLDESRTAQGRELVRRGSSEEGPGHKSVVGKLLRRMHIPPSQPAMVELLQTAPVRGLLRRVQSSEARIPSPTPVRHEIAVTETVEKLRGEAVLPKIQMHDTQHLGQLAASTRSEEYCVDICG